MNSKFPRWLEARFFIWQLRQTQRQSLRAYAKFLGFDHVVVVRWMHGTRRPTPENALVLARRYGSEVFDVLGLERPDKTGF